MNNITLKEEAKQLCVVDITQLYQHLEQVTDKREARGKRYKLSLLLLVIILAKLSGEDTPSGIAEWARLRGQILQKYVGYHRPVVPSHNTIRRTLSTSLEEEQLQEQLTHYLHQAHGGQESILVVLDGKTMRGTIPKGDTQGVYLLAAYLPEEGVVLMQLEVGDRENEISATPRLLELVDLKGRVVSGDAMFAQRSISVQVLAQGGDYVWQLKGNQATLRQDVERFFETPSASPGWHKAALPRTVAEHICKSRGRLEQRRLTLISDEHAYLQWPGVRQCFQLERRVVHLKQDTETVEYFYGITSLAPEATSAEQLLHWTRQHWDIENGLHYRRDVTLHEDATRMSDTHQARVVATLNNLIVALARLLGFDNLASLRRTFQVRLDAALFAA